MSLVLTKMQNWRVSNPQLDKNMTRPSEYGALDFFERQTSAPNSILSPELKQRAFQSAGNTVQVPVINYDSNVSVSNSRSCTIADLEGTSALVNVSWTTYAIGFTMVPAAFMNNDISYQHDFNRKMEKCARALASALDTAAVAALEANKTKVYANSLQYTVTSDVLVVPKQLETEVLSDIDAMMAANDYFGQTHIVGNMGVRALLYQLAQHGLYNDANKQMEYLNKVFHFTNNVANETGYMRTFYAVNDGNVGMLTRVDREALRGTRANFHEWGVVNMPFIGVPVGYHYYTAVGDQHTMHGDATADLTCGVKEYFGFSIDAAFMTSYNSATSTVANPIMKAKIASPTSGEPIARPVYITNASDFS